jgi:hypothetical protein
VFDERAESHLWAGIEPLLHAFEGIFLGVPAEVTPLGLGAVRFRAQVAQAAVALFAFERLACRASGSCRSAVGR